MPLTVTGFEVTGLISDAEVHDLIISRLPLPALRDLTRVEYVDVYNSRMRDDLDLASVLIRGTHIKATRFDNEATGEKEIHIYRQKPGGSDDPAELYSSILQEIGYGVYTQNQSLVNTEWISRLGNAREQEGTTGRGQRSDQDDFCDSFAFFYLDPIHLQAASPTRYAFFEALDHKMRDE